ncbi:MAG: hypothetical protein RLZZ128_1130, partial [Actinomycetota bacterium]
PNISLGFGCGEFNDDVDHHHDIEHHDIEHRPVGHVDRQRSVGSANDNGAGGNDHVIDNSTIAGVPELFRA